MSEKGAKCKQTGFGPLKKHDMICNDDNGGNEISEILMSDRPIEDHIIKNFDKKGDVLQKENRWTIDFKYGSDHFVVYFTEEAAKRFREEVNKSFSTST